MFVFLESIFAVLRALLIFLDIVFLILFVYVLRQAMAFRPDLRLRKARTTVHTLRKALVEERWGPIARRFSEGSADGMKLAIIEADKLIDTVLKDAGFHGDTMADRLERLSKADLRTLDRLWRAHRIRNEIVHSADFEISPSLAERTFGDYEAFLKEIGLLDAKPPPQSSKPRDERALPAAPSSEGRKL